MTDQPATTRPAPEICCACCGKRMDAVWQPPLLDWHEGMFLLSCVNRACPEFAFTYSDRDYPEVLFAVYGVQQ